MNANAAFDGAMARGYIEKMSVFHRSPVLHFSYKTCNYYFTAHCTPPYGKNSCLIVTLRPGLLPPRREDFKFPETVEQLRHTAQLRLQRPKRLATAEEMPVSELLLRRHSADCSAR
jgi:hypothetical protein